MMPSGARLMTAILMALALSGCVFLAAWHNPSLGEAANRLYGFAAAIGFFFGWGALGGRLGGGFVKSSGRAVAVMTVAGFWFFALLAGRAVLLGMTYHAYRRPGDAFEALIQHFMNYVTYASDYRVLLAAFVGALIAGAMGEYFRMIWN